MSVFMGYWILIRFEQNRERERERVVPNPFGQDDEKELFQSSNSISRGKKLTWKHWDFLK